MVLLCVHCFSGTASTPDIKLDEYFSGLHTNTGHNYDTRSNSNSDDSDSDSDCDFEENYDSHSESDKDSDEDYNSEHDYTTKLASYLGSRDREG